MDIFNSEPRKIRCVDVYDCAMCGNGTGDRDKLEIGKEYTLADINIGNWATMIWLEELEGSFNSVWFDEVE